MGQHVRQLAMGAHGQPDPLRLVEGLGWGLSFSALAADTNGLDAVLVPRDDGSFDCLVDPRLASSERWQAAGEPPASAQQLVEATLRFRVAHEIGHLFFYSTESPSRHIGRVTADEEAFCDRFAMALLISHESMAVAPATAHGVIGLAANAGTTPAIAAAGMVEFGTLSAAVAGTRTAGDRIHIVWSAGLAFDPRGWELPIPAGHGVDPAWALIVDDPATGTCWADGAKALVVFPV